MADTTYEMLLSRDDGATWEHIGKQESGSRDAALRAFFGAPADGVQYVAVAGTNWQPVKLQPRTIIRKVLAPVTEATDTPDPAPDVPADAEPDQQEMEVIA